MHGERPRGEVVFFEEVLGGPVTGQRDRVDPDAPTFGAEGDEVVDDALPHPDLARSLVDEEIGDDAEIRAGSQSFDHHRAEPEHDVVDGAHYDTRVVSREQRAVRVLEWFGPRFAFHPEVATTESRELGAHGDRELDDGRDVLLAGGPAALHV